MTLEPLPGVLGFPETGERLAHVAATDGSPSKLAAPRRHDEQQGPLLRRVCLGDTPQAIMAREAGEPCFLGREDVRRESPAIDSNSGVGARDEQADRLAVHPARQIVLRDAVLEEREPPTGPAESVGVERSDDIMVDLGRDQVAQLRINSACSAGAVADQPEPVGGESIPVMGIAVDDEPRIDLGVGGSRRGGRGARRCPAPCCRDR